MDKTSIDEAHANLLSGLVSAFKPNNVLEFGFGTGRSAEAILAAATHNRNRPKYTLVDNWHDFGGSEPRELDDLDEFYSAEILVVTSSEKDFIINAMTNGEQYDFIFSDADHLHAHEWFDETFDSLLCDRGILIYHDVMSPDFPNLRTIYDKVRQRGFSHCLFNAESRADERCSRGLLVIFKACG